MSQIEYANKCFREEKLDEAKSAYKSVIYDYNSNPKNVHKLIYLYAKKQIKALEPEKNYKFKSNNIILTAVNSKYFQTVLQMVESAFNTSNDVIDKIVIFDFGLEKWQVEILEKIQKLETFNFKDIELDVRLKKFDVNDPSTYFFKVYAFHFWSQALEYQNSKNVNLLWIDSGIKIEQSLKEIFYIIETEGSFFVDHSDVSLFYKNPQNSLINILSPKIKEADDYVELSDEQMLTPYIKANFFGLNLGGKYSYIIDEHLNLCLNTNILFEPRNITNKKEQEYWIKNTSIMDSIINKGSKNSGKYMNGRHEQSVWSYLVAKENIKVYDSKRFNFTVSPGSGTQTKDTWEKKIKQLLDENFGRYKESLILFLKENNVDKIPSNSDQLISEYIEKAKEVYFDNPMYLSPAFPIPKEAKFSTVLLHRGSLSLIDQEKYIGRFLNGANNIKEEPFILMGNGPSLGDVDFQSLKGMDTMGLNAAYRQYDNIDFWPKYFGCFDGLVCNDHSSEFKKLIRNSPIEKFFFININDEKKAIFTEDDIVNSEKFQNINFQYRTKDERDNLNILSTTFDPFMDMRTSGPNSILTALILGYRKIIMLGVDQNYVEVVDGATKNGNYHKLIMEKTPEKNENYWFSDYQQEGDKFNRPNLQGSQISSWDNLSKTLDNLGIKVEIYNCSPITTLNSFKKASLPFALKKFSKIASKDLSSFKSQLNK